MLFIRDPGEGVEFGGARRGLGKPDPICPAPCLAQHLEQIPSPDTPSLPPSSESHLSGGTQTYDTSGIGRGSPELVSAYSARKLVSPPPCGSPAPN